MRQLPPPNNPSAAVLRPRRCDAACRISLYGIKAARKRAAPRRFPALPLVPRSGDIRRLGRGRAYSEGSSEIRSTAQGRDLSCVASGVHAWEASAGAGVGTFGRTRALRLLVKSDSAAPRLMPRIPRRQAEYLGRRQTETGAACSAHSSGVGARGFGR